MKNKEKIDKTLQTIANVLYVNRHRIQQVGLLTGKMGAAIYLYRYARYCEHSAYETLADDFIDEVMSNKMSGARHPNFPGGISGLVWGFRYLIENKFIEVEGDTILNELEALLLKNISGKAVAKKAENIDLFGVGLYYTSKFKLQPACEDSMLALNALLKKCRMILREYTSSSVFDIKCVNFLLYFLTEMAKRRVKERAAFGLLADVRDILLKQADYSIYGEEDIYILQKNIEQLRSLTSKKDEWDQIQLRLPHNASSCLRYFSWPNFIYFSFGDMQVNDSWLDEIAAYVEEKLDCLLDSDLVLSGKLLNIGVGLLYHIQ
jgi:hypothetical protein